MKISVIIPVYNEEANLPELKSVLDEVMQSNHFDWEAVLVDDGSRDNSAKVLDSFVQADPAHYHAVILRRNFGQTAAIAAGIDYSSGELIVFMRRRHTERPERHPHHDRTKSKKATTW